MFKTLRNAWKIEDLRKKMIFTLIIIVIFRLGVAMPVPFLDPSALGSMVNETGSMLGYINLLNAERVKLGFIGAIRDLEIHRLPLCGETLHTTIENLEEVFGMLLVQAEVRVNDALLAAARMKIALSEIDAQP